MSDERTSEPMLTKDEWMERLDQALDVIRYREQLDKLTATHLEVVAKGEAALAENAEMRTLLVCADSLLSIVAYRGVGAVDDEWKGDAKELIMKLRAAAKAPRD